MTQQKPRPRSCIPSIAAHIVGTATDRAHTTGMDMGRAPATTARHIAGTVGIINAGRRRAGGAVITTTDRGSTGVGCAWKSLCATAKVGGGTAIDQQPADLIEQDAETAGVRDVPVVFLH